MALPHLHLHAQAVQEVSREGQAVHGRERGIDPACGGHTWLALHGALTPGSRPLPGPTPMSQHGLSTPVHLEPPKGALAWPHAVSRRVPQEGRRPCLSQASSRYRGACCPPWTCTCRVGRRRDGGATPGRAGFPPMSSSEMEPGPDSGEKLTGGNQGWGWPRRGETQRHSETQKSVETEGPRCDSERM